MLSLSDFNAWATFGGVNNCKDLFLLNCALYFPKSILSLKQKNGMKEVCENNSPYGLNNIEVMRS